MDAALKTKLIKDLQKAGFESEMQTIHAIESSGWSCSGASVYFDKDESITRSVDAHADLYCGVWSNDEDVHGDLISTVDYNMFIEVKKSERPWVVFRRAAASHADTWFMYQKSIRGLTEDQVHGMRKVFRKESLTEKTGWQGYGVHEAFKEPQESGRWYAAAVSVCKACSNFIGDGDGKCVPQEDYGMSVVQPIVVLDGPLVAAKLLSSGEMELETILYAPFLFEFGTENYKRRSYRVDLVSLAGLPRYLEFCTQRTRALHDAFEQIAKKVDKTIHPDEEVVKFLEGKSTS